MCLAGTVAEAGDIGLERMRQRLGAAAPNGNGVAVSLVEANHQGQDSAPDVYRYMPNGADERLAGKTIRDESGLTHPPGATSSHATDVAAALCGNGGVAPGVQDLDVYVTANWLAAGCLRTLSPVAPARPPTRLINHSWVSDPSDTPATIDALRRLDYVIDRYGTTMVVGANNGSNTQMPLWLAHSYNSIAVGVSDGNSSPGPTRLAEEGAGRAKPDLVCPENSTSGATARTSGAAAILLETARQTTSAVDAARPETIKAILLAGAVKNSLDFKFPWRHSIDHPLDARLGAGQLDVNNSQRLLAANRWKAGETSSTGWDVTETAAGQDRRYTFEIAVEDRRDELSIALVWNRQVLVQPVSLDSPAQLKPLPLADLDLRLERIDSAGQAVLVDTSASRIDNVEHIYVPQPLPGRYVVHVIGNAGKTRYAVAWQTRGRVVPQPTLSRRQQLIRIALITAAVAMISGLILVALWQIRRRRRGIYWIT